MLPCVRSLPHEDRLQQLGLWTLEERRNRPDLIEVFKMVMAFLAYRWLPCFNLIHLGGLAVTPWNWWNTDATEMSESTCFHIELSPNGTGWMTIQWQRRQWTVGDSGATILQVSNVSWDYDSSFATIMKTPECQTKTSNYVGYRCGNLKHMHL